MAEKLKKVESSVFTMDTNLLGIIWVPGENDKECLKARAYL